MAYEYWQAGARTRRGLVALAALLFLGACAELPTEYSKETSTAIPFSEETDLGRQVAPLVAAHPGRSGFYLLPEGVDALGTRLRLADRTEASIDVQYYLMLPDIVGYLLFDRLAKAADRGVRVRVLMDDISTEGYEQMFAVLAAKPNFEIRLTNPFADRDARGLDGLSDFQRVNHRMHNKSITFDNAVTVFGGRNIGAEYFGAGDVFNYHDLDTLAIGTIAEDVSAEFDTYWNAAESYPVTAFVEPDDSEEAAEQLQQRFADTVESAQATPYAPALRHTMTDLLVADDNNVLVWAPATVVFDLPYGDTSDAGVAGPEILAPVLIDAINQARTEMFMVSPYFVPGDSGVERFRELRERGIRCVVVTNSLASTDVAAVYAGYRNYYRALLEIGVELWEVMAFPSGADAPEGASIDKRSLHAKTFAVDRQQLFVGSFNWDPRSIGINTEMGAIIESGKLASQMVDAVSSALPLSAWKVRLREDGEVEWVDLSGSEEVVFTTNPQTDFALRQQANLTDISILEGQL